MTVTAQTPFNDYVGNGSVKEFAYTFRILREEQMKVLLDGEEQAVGFTITKVGQPTGGTVTFNIAPGDGVEVRLRRSTTPTRDTDYTEGGNLSAETLDDDQDYQTMLLQELIEFGGVQELNDLTDEVTWAPVPDGFITESSVTQHEAALTITEAQISDLQSYLVNLVDDTSPQLGGELDINGSGINTGIGSPSIVISPEELSFLDGVTSNIQDQLDNSSSTLAGLSDVDLTGSPGPVNGDVLTFNGSDWVHLASSSATLSGLTDTTITGVANNEIIVWETDHWENQTLTEAGILQNIVEDTSPQLGGNLDVSGNSIVSVSNGNITLTPDGTGRTKIKNVQAPVPTDEPGLGSPEEYTTVLDDAGRMKIINNTGAMTVTVDDSLAYDDDTEISFYQKGTGTVTITVSGSPDPLSFNTTFTNNIIGQHGVVTVKKLGTDDWILFGQLEVA